jgi:alpha-N-arabinofuranosidase
MAGALGDAAWMTGMERNSDIVLLESYAPLFVNVSDLHKTRAEGGSMQWASDLIGYDALTSYGSPSYYAQQMFSTHHGDTVLATSAQGIPTYSWQPTIRRRKDDHTPPPPRPPTQSVPCIFYDATRASETGTIFVKLVNRQGTAQPVQIAISGTPTVKSEGRLTLLQGDSPDDTNSLEQPQKIVPQTSVVRDFGQDMTYVCPPYSISILELQTK